MKTRYSQVLTTLEKIRDNENDREVSTEAAMYIEQLSSFSFVLTLLIYDHIFDITTPLSTYLQTKNVDFIQATDFVNVAIKKLNDLRNEESFEKFLTIAKSFAAENDLETEFRVKRIPRKKTRLAEETTSDERPQNEVDRYRIETYYEMVSTITQAMNDRFSKNNSNLLEECALLSEERLSKLFHGKNFLD